MKSVIAYSLPLGTKCFYYDIHAIIVGKASCKKQTLIAWNGSKINFGWKYGSYGKRPTDNMLDHHDSFQWYWWLFDDAEVFIKSDLILNSKQVCDCCNLPAPHTKPNVGDKFVCVSCNFLSGI